MGVGHYNFDMFNEHDSSVLSHGKSKMLMVFTRKTWGNPFWEISRYPYQFWHIVDHICQSKTKGMTEKLRREMTTVETWDISRPLPAAQWPLDVWMPWRSGKPRYHLWPIGDGDVIHKHPMFLIFDGQKGPNPKWQWVRLNLDVYVFFRYTCNV